jgi:hypothetical protein
MNPARITAGEEGERRSAAPPPLTGVHPSWRRAAVLGPVAAGVVFAFGTAVSLARAPALAAGMVAVVLTAGAVLAAAFTQRSTAAAWWWSACGACGAGWLGYAAAAGPWSWPAAVGLLLPAALLAAAWPVIKAHEERLAYIEQAPRATTPPPAAEGQWPALLARIGYPGVALVRREETLCGYSALLWLPPSGRVTYTQLAASRENLEVAARIRHGSLRFERGQAAHEVILHVAERDVLAETIPLPADDHCLTITQPIAIGVHEDGQVCTLTLREVATLIVGLRGSGKSNLLNVLIAQLARCPDVLIFVIDQKGGRMAAPWLAPWLAGKTPRPVIDWLATTREEAEVMLRACLRGIEARSRSGSGGEKIIPSPGQPAIMLIVDEAAVIFGLGTGGPRSSLGGTTNSQLAALGTQITMLGRSEAIDPVFATQRGTATMTGSGDLKSQCGLRIGLGVASETDAQLIIPDDVGIAADLATLAHPGCGIVQVKHGRVMPVKFFRLEHEQIGPIAERAGRIRPGPDPLLARALGADYANRWRSASAGGVPGPRAGGLPGRGASGLPAEAASGLSGAPAGGLPAAPAHRAVARMAAVTNSPGSTDAEFRAIVSGVELTGLDRPAITEEAGHPARHRMRDYIRRLGDRGATPGMIQHLLGNENMTVELRTVHRWLVEDEAVGLVERGTLDRWRSTG